eukprot:GHRQ01036444.1.p1 GENE.GHRQ01036444.1~~GHRQ01036444.1.p1  ORF type:complete len:100 (+),score=32.14 GHRQ01036444.1:37-336(+)
MAHAAGCFQLWPRWDVRVCCACITCEQGDRERAVGLPVSPLMDRSKQGISRSQVGFFDIVALPFYTSLAQRFPGCRPMLEAVLENYAVWKAQEQQHRSS